MLKELSAWKNSDKICLCSHWAAGEILPPFCVLKGVSRHLRQKPDEARWHHPCKFVANKRKSQIEIHLADAILH